MLSGVKRSRNIPLKTLTTRSSSLVAKKSKHTSNYQEKTLSLHAVTDNNNVTLIIITN